MLVLPLLKAAAGYSLLRIRHEACASILEASLPAAYQAVSREALSQGRLELDQVQAREQVAGLLARNMAAARLEASLLDLTVTFATISRPEAPGHWLAGPRPAEMPMVAASAEWLFSDGWHCRVDDRIELVLD